MANLQLWGPVMWVHSPGQNGLLPGEEHDWFATDFFPGNPAVFQVTAHPFGDFVVAELAVINLRVFQLTFGPPGIYFTVRNVGSAEVNFYNVFFSGVGA